jgi:hypothetical protein
MGQSRERVGRVGNVRGVGPRLDRMILLATGSTGIGPRR